MTNPTTARTPDGDPDGDLDDELHPSAFERAAVILAVILIAFFLWSSIGHSQLPRWTQADGLLAAQACVHEATWAGVSTNDCGGIIEVVETRRREGETFSSALRRTMPRFTTGRTDRSWALHLPFGPITRNPEGWPFPVGARLHSSAWAGVMARVHGYMRDGVPLPCTPAPSSWMGPGPDGHVIAERLASGRWRTSECGETRNVFLYQVDVN